MIIDDKGFIKVQCKYFIENLSRCPKQTCIFKFEPFKIFPDIYYGCSKLNIDWVSYLKNKEHVILLKE